MSAKLRMYQKDRLSRFEGEALLAAIRWTDKRMLPTTWQRALERAKERLDARSREYAAEIRNLEKVRGRNRA